MPARLRSVPDAQPRAVGLIRVSKLGDRLEEDLLSPEIQRTAIEDHCARRGYALTQWVEGIDESGSQARSKWWAKLDECIAMVEAGDADVLVVWKFSRVARARLRWAVAVDRVEVAGGLIESAAEPLDVSTSSGRLARGVLKEFDAYQSEVIGDGWREAHARRVARGLPANGKPRFGYDYVDGLHRPSPDTGPVLAELYRRYIAGASFYALAHWLNDEGVLTAAGYSTKGPGPWSPPALRSCMDRGFGAGLITVHGELQRGAHEPVIDEATWEAYRAARGARRMLKRAERSPYLLSAMVWCSCGFKMGGGAQARAGAGPRFRCLSWQTAGAEPHAGGYVLMRIVEAEVQRWLRELADSASKRTDAQRAARAHAMRRARDADALARALIELDKSLTKLTVDEARDNGRTPAAIWQAARREMLDERSTLERRHRAALADAQAGEPAKRAAELLAHWDVLSVEGRRGGLRELIGRVVVQPGKPKARVKVIPRWELNRG